LAGFSDSVFDLSREQLEAAFTVPDSDTSEDQIGEVMPA
jgi:hypothetical protein